MVFFFIRGHVDDLRTYYENKYEKDKRFKNLLDAVKIEPNSFDIHDCGSIQIGDVYVDDITPKLVEISSINQYNNNNNNSNNEKNKIYPLEHTKNRMLCC